MEHRQVGMRSGLTRLFIRDGGMFFGLLAAANLVNVVFFLASGILTSPQLYYSFILPHLQKVKASVFEESAGNNSVLTHTLSSTLLSRLILNLREAGSKLDTTGTQLSIRFSLAPGDDIMLVSSSTFSNRHNSNSVTTRSSDYPWTTIPSLSMAGSTAVGSIGTVVEHELEAPTMRSQLDSLSHL
ncbi:uncharacterized protein FOMMEDRAFT_156483 [Fomitiporia mediterranea MF3/22]|uniref:uncharacterized protein n=1 Tax=Fomitiporia mediterranea (strain MF3/22) TaxID=694068 RepID=UPI00044072BF|nr:uncharacterized protein FOMMEDRAFT_156483 [Fomitiporia mediterranea MF3/22]EJD03111.1 hypothetical protein FOMMEDRAFT_156483 [Fomitiporia mediterranea MF3/22]